MTPGKINPRTNNSNRVRLRESSRFLFSYSKELGGIEKHKLKLDDSKNKTTFLLVNCIIESPFLLQVEDNSEAPSTHPYREEASEFRPNTSYC